MTLSKGELEEQMVGWAERIRLDHKPGTIRLVLEEAFAEGAAEGFQMGYSRGFDTGHDAAMREGNHG